LKSGNYYKEDDFMEEEYSNYKEKINKSANGKAGREYWPSRTQKLNSL
jgi:hypothetical protein